MKCSRKVGALMHKLLIEDKMDGFSVVELRDAAIVIEQDLVNLGNARRTVYRQVLRFTKNHWLRSEGSGRQKRYFQTDLFKTLQSTAESSCVDTVSSARPDYSILGHERNHSKGELEIVLGEIKEYQSLNERFPELAPKLNPYLEQAKERSAHLLGKINVLTNALNTLSGSSEKC
ncbi:hypothetical protein CGK42_20610 [Vibrio parahaemolyticus]|uniref:hypothetical protein n=1 Tax=Vibrio parahaemolyticus TaxID=670 RepID=UPI0011245848|nr:hypothetical protein [Vibrio parahaemolyticus]TNZ67685.1 hypothetical protein CGK42_20610 [Vibrio parahaemolyticus]